MPPSAEASWLSEKRRLARFHLECEQPGVPEADGLHIRNAHDCWSLVHSILKGFGGVRRRQAAPEDADYSLDSPPPLHSSTPLAGTGSKDWRRNFAVNKSLASSSASNYTSNNGDWSLGGDSGYGGFGSSRLSWPIYQGRILPVVN